MATHNTLTGAEVHEPKGMDAATAGASDIGKVVASNGAGASTIRKLIPAEVGMPEHYGQLTVSNNATVIAMTIAADTTLATNTDYIKVTAIFDAIPHGLNNGITQQADTLTAITAGVYKVEVWADTSSSINSNTIAFKFAINGTIGLTRRPKNFMRNAGEFHNLAAFGFVTLLVGEVVSLHIASDKTADITIEDLVFSLTLIRAT